MDSKKKKPPPKKKKPKRFPVKPTPFGVQPRTKVAEITRSGLEWMRQMAGIRYTTNQAGLSLKELSEEVPFDQLSKGTLDRWCAEDGWVEDRRKYFAGIRVEIEAQISKKMVESRVEQLHEADAIFMDLATEIRAGKVKANTKEGLVNALTRLFAVGDSVREKISKEVVPAHFGEVQGEGSQLAPTMTVEEARVAATALIRFRRLQARQQARALAEAEKVEGPEKPQLRIVQGEGDSDG